MAYIKSVQFDDLKLRLKDGQLTDKTNKVLTITANEQCFKTRTASITLNANTLCWKEKLIVKVANEKQLTFELTDRYQFGYDPDRLVRVLQGTMRVYTDREKQRSWEVFDEKQTRVGTLSATVVDQFHADNPHATVMLVPPLSQAEARQEAPPQASHRKQDPEVRTLTMNRPSRHFLTIFSIISNLKKDVIGMEGAYALIKAGPNKSIKTSHSKGSSTQHAWVDTLKLIVPPEVEHVEFTLVGFEGIEQHILCVGELSLQQFQRKKRIVSQRIEMMDSGGVAGEIFVDVRCTTELEHERGRDAILRNSRLYASIDVAPQTKRSREKTSLVALTPRSGAHTQEFGQMRPTKPSVVLANNSIVFSKERRFQSYRDRQSPIVSYLKNDLQTTHSSHYRGAHIGYGSKEDFTRSSRYTPGVGEYHLPSIFDRY